MKNNFFKKILMLAALTTLYFGCGPGLNLNSKTDSVIKPRLFPTTQQGSKLVGTSAVGNAQQGNSVDLSTDGNTAIVGGYRDNSNIGGAWIFTRTNGVWSQQGIKLVGSGIIGSAYFGYGVSISGDGNTAAVSGYFDNTGIGAVWIFTRTNGVWSQQGSKFTGTGVTGGAANFGNSLSLSTDGDHLIVGGVGDNSSIGAAWIFTRTSGVWSQQGAKLTAADSVGSARFGESVSISADGNTAAIGASADNSNVGATFIFTRTNGVWTQQGPKIVGSGGISAKQGSSVALSGDGNTVLSGGLLDNTNIGAAWIFIRTAGVWTQQGSKIIGNDTIGTARFGVCVSLSSDGDTALIGGSIDNSNTGAMWIFTRTAGVWSQLGSKLVGTGASGNASQGSAVALSGDGETAISGGYNDSSSLGASWIFAP